MWRYRERLSYFEKLKRSLYEILRDALEARLIKISLIDSYFFNYIKNGVPYNFVDKKELKPRCKKMEKESELFNTFIVIFCEGVVPAQFKNYIRFFPYNSLVKKNLEYLANFSLHKEFHKDLRHFENPDFFNFLEKLLNVDYALLLQQDPTVKKKNRYSLTHFHVKIDWPIADAAEDLAKSLRYIQNNLYENGEKQARILQNKLFEYYGCHYTVGGRRTAGLISAQLLKKLNAISTVYVSSSESRSLFRYSERGVSKFFLVRLAKKQIQSLARREGMKVETFMSQYLYSAGNAHVGISEASYVYTEHSLPPKDGKLRKLDPAYNWLKLRAELLHPKIDEIGAKPINYHWIYHT